jgi:FKBP-type peptidyl-prolyl cis-trans isomerase FkpA
MKSISYLLVAIAFIAVSTSCSKVGYRKTKTGLLYKIIPGGSKDSALKNGDWIKFMFVQKKNDSMMQNNYDRAAVYQPINIDPNARYSPAEVFPLLKKGDSAVVIMFIDTLIKQGVNLPPFFKKGDKLIYNFKVVDVFRSESAKQADEMAEAQRMAPRMKKIKEEDDKKMMKELVTQKDQAFQDAEKSGDGPAERKALEQYLAARHITAQKTPRGAYVVITEQGTGPQAADGKYVVVKYNGKLLNDSSFQQGTYPFQLGMRRAIDGWDEGLPLFKEGGKGTLYVPGYLAYGKNPEPNSPFKPNEALIFDVEVLNVSDTMPPQMQQQPQR